MLAAAAAAQSPAVIESVELVGQGEAAVVNLVATKPLRWFAGSQEQGLRLHLTDCLAAPGVSDLNAPEGLVARVEIVPVPHDPPAVDLVVVTRQPVSYQAKAIGRVLQIRFRPLLRESSPAVPPLPSFATGFDEIRIGALDVLEVEVFGFDELSRKVRVLRDGTISLPLLGNVEVNGLSLPEAESRITRLLTERQLVRQPQVTIVIEEHVSYSVSVQGAVSTPGLYSLAGGKTLFEILSEAGGLGEGAGSNIFVLRRTPAGEERIEIDAERLLGQAETSLNIPLRPGDVISVPHRKILRVFVNGAVNRPGEVEFPSSEGITVLQAITAAGGLTERASAGKIHILRQCSDGTQERIPVQLKKIKKGKIPDVPLAKNDVVVVGEWFF